MSMILGLVSLADSAISQILKDPRQVWRIIAPDDPEMHEQGTLDLTGSELASTDLDKAWHGIHYLLTGTVWEGDPPLNVLVSGGQAVGKIDVGYGPARALTSDQVKAVNNALAQLSDTELRSRFRPKDMLKKGIYPEIWDRDPKDDDTLGYLLHFVTILRKFLDNAVAKRQGVVLYLS